MRTTLALATVLLLLPALTTQAQDPAPAAPRKDAVYIGPKWTKGQSMRLKMTMESSTEQDNPMLGKVKSHMVFTSVSNEVVKEISDSGVVTTELDYESLSFRSEAMGTVTEWDSTKKAENEDKTLAVVYGNMLKHKYTVTYDASGKVSAVKGFDAMLENAIKELDGDEQTKEMMRSTLQSSMSDKAMLRTMSAGSFYPSKPVGTGEEWNLSYEVPVPTGSGALAVAIKYKLTGLENSAAGQMARIIGEGTVASAPKKEPKEGEEPEPEPQGVFAMFDYTYENGKQQVEITYNVDKSELVKSVVKQTMDMKMTVKSADMVINSKVANTVTTEALPPKPAEGTGAESKPENEAK